MKICWDNLEKHEVYLSKKGNFRSKIQGILYYKDSCKNCKEPFLSERPETIYCCKLCANKCEERRKKASISLSGQNNPQYGKPGPWKGKKRSIETRKKMSKTKKGKLKGYKNTNWRGGYNTNNTPTYDLYAPQISWCEQVRKNKEDPNILEVKCIYCGKWFVPKRTNVKGRISYLKGNGTCEYRFYCSKGCKFNCPIFRRLSHPKDFKLATAREVQPDLRKMAFKRDNWECQKCGSCKELHCHHVEGILWEPLQSADLDMVITVCKDCHEEIHKKEGCKKSDMRCKEI